MLDLVRGARWRALLVLIATVVAVLGPAVPAGAGAEDFEAEFVAKINELRASKGLQQLSVDAELTSIGRRWSASMAAAGKISHNPDFPEWVTSDWQRLGENVGVGPTVQSLFDAFVNSPSHYANLVHPDYDRIGVGVVLAGDVMYTSHQFMQLRAAAAPAPARAPAAPARRTQASPPVAPPEPAAPAAAPTPAPAPVVPAPVAPVTSPALAGVLEQLHQLDRQAA